MVIEMRKNIQCTIVGDGFVGKSCFIRKYVDGKCSMDYIATLKDAYQTSSSVNGENYDLTINDLAGEHEDVSSLEIPDVFIICFSLVDRDSMESVLSFWFPEVRASSKQVPIVLMGTQMDLRKTNKKGHISTAEGQFIAKAMGADHYIECSAKTGEGVQESFLSIVKIGVKYNNGKEATVKRVLGR